MLRKIEEEKVEALIVEHGIEDEAVTTEQLNLYLVGKGIICEVFFVDGALFQKLTKQSESEQVALRELVCANADASFSICKGFCVDQPSVVCAFGESGRGLLQLPLGDNEAWKSVLGNDNSYVTDGDYDGLEKLHHRSEDEEISLDPEPDQICLVSYTEFEEGVTSVTLPVGSISDIQSLYFETVSVDSTGFVGEITYDETIVGTEEYEEAESAIQAVLINGERVPIAAPRFSAGRSRVWMYVWSEDEGNHQMDFLASKELNWKQDYKLVIEGIGPKV